MKLFYKIMTAVILLNSYSLFSQAVFTSQATGQWNTASTWTYTGTDADGIPDADDDVIIRAHSITVSVNSFCNSLKSEPLANNTVGLEVFVHDVIAAIKTSPLPISIPALVS
mgnify:CR=1 FL=1